MANNNDNWERIFEVVRMSDMTVNGFAHHIGLARGENLYQIKRGNNGISRDLADRIVAKFPNISKSWLLTGSGYMYANEAQRSAQIPFYSGDAEHSLELLEHRPCEYYMFVPQITDADFAIRYRGHAMEPDVPDGAILILKKATLEAVIWNTDYLVQLPEETLLRTVTAADEDGYLLLRARNRDMYDDKKVKFTDVQTIYALSGKLYVM